jgi:hypothetical protein
MKNWQSLYDGLLIPTTPKVRWVSKPTVADLQAFEKEMKVKLPVDYRSFILLFGPGELAGEFFVLSPGYEKTNIDLKHVTLEFRRGLQDRWVRQSFENPEFICSLIFFCRTFHGDRFAWDPQDITDSKQHDYRIHHWLHEAPKTKIVANTFCHFIEDICLGDEYFTKYSLTGERTLAGPREVFTPAVQPPRRRKKKPGSGKQRK